MQFEPAAKGCFFWVDVRIDRTDIRSYGVAVILNGLVYYRIWGCWVSRCSQLQCLNRYWGITSIIRHCLLNNVSSGGVTIPVEQCNQLGLVNHQLGQSLVLGESILGSAHNISYPYPNWTGTRFIFFCPLAKAMQYCVSWWFYFTEPLRRHLLVDARSVITNCWCSLAIISVGWVDYLVWTRSWWRHDNCRG